MTDTNQTTIRFFDVSNDEEALVVVRTFNNSVGLTLSLKNDGDVEVFLEIEELRALIVALQKSAETIAG